MALLRISGYAFSVSLLLLLTVFGAHGASNDKGTLGRCDTLPNMSMLLHFGEDSTKVVKLDDLHKKLIIFDFWDTRCSECIAALPHMSELMDKFGDNLQVVVVSKQPFGMIRATYDRLKRMGIPRKVLSSWDRLPFIANDSLLNSFFPHRGNPIHVWIDGNRVYKFMTYGMNTTDLNVYRFIKCGNTSGLDEVVNEDIDSIYRASIGMLPVTRSADGLFLSSTRPRLEHGYLGPIESIVDDESHKGDKFTCLTNYSIIDLYRKVFDGVAPATIAPFGYISDDRFFILSRSKERFAMPPSDSDYFGWMGSNLLCYAFKLEKNVDSSKIRYYIKDDLDKRFHLKSSIKKTYASCYVIKVLGNKKLVDQNALTSSDVFYNDDSGILRDRSMGEIVGRFRFILQKKDKFVSVIDETGFKGSLKISLPYYDQDISFSQFKEILNKHGFDITKEVKYVDRIVLQDSY